MLFAAGRGTRMGALTETRPKPMIEVAGRPLIDHALALADAVGAAPIVVNLHHLGAQIARHLAARPIAISWEPVLLETGGGLRQALPKLGAGPVMTLNADAVWSGTNPLQQLAAAWDETRMDALLLLAPKAQTRGHNGTGDFLQSDDGRIQRAAGAEAPIYLGAQIIRTEGLADIDEDVFSLNRLWDVLIARGRAFGLIHQGGWCDVGRPEGIAQAEALLAEAAG